MRYKTTKLDGRHANRDLYQYVIEFGKYNYPSYQTGVLDFHKALQWFNRTWGFSVAVDLQQQLVKDALMATLSGAAHEYDELNLHWAYSSQYRDFRIYVRGEEELALFELVHAGG
jgi:hypothetical protein